MALKCVEQFLLQPKTPTPCRRSLHRRHRLVRPSLAPAELQCQQTAVLVSNWLAAIIYRAVKQILTCYSQSHSCVLSAAHSSSCRAWSCCSRCCSCSSSCSSCSSSCSGSCSCSCSGCSCLCSGRSCCRRCCRPCLSLFCRRRCSNSWAASHPVRPCRHRGCCRCQYWHSTGAPSAASRPWVVSALGPGSRVCSWCIPGAAACFPGTKCRGSPGAGSRYGRQTAMRVLHPWRRPVYRVCCCRRTAWWQLCQLPLRQRRSSVLL